MGMTNELSYNDEGTCEKIRYNCYSAAAERAFADERYFGDKRKVYYCWRCVAFHTARERMKGDVPLLER